MNVGLRTIKAIMAINRMEDDIEASDPGNCDTWSKELAGFMVEPNIMLLCIVPIVYVSVCIPPRRGDYFL